MRQTTETLIQIVTFSI